MYKDILDKVMAYETIIIHRHSKPDFDAIGSQVGLMEIIKENFPEKAVYVVGDQNRFDMDKDMQNILDETYQNALVFILDVAVKHMVSDERYKLAKEVIVIDHHKNDCDIENVSLVLSDSTFSACAELITDWALELELIINKRAASFLYAGIVTDTGRFQWMHKPERVFLIASMLTAHGAKTTELYDFLYVETLESKQMKNYFASRFVFEDGVAYLKNDQDVFEKFNVDVFTVSRGMINLAAGIEDIKIWLNFTFDKEKNAILGEFRARGLKIVDIAKKYGGGGHEQACGAVLKTWDEVDQVIQDFKQLLKESN
ncbi:bifunctional oligoribonuclease/PAP phosphatase NrnA [Acholeplasma vituli]|uniref:Bifunctional oligoribonuclease/PAP phosphatase NrnA n=1 Tax=Paracholeplasma vituli TaxID=69473 RepID=A0ABT2PXC7_9MOLU|nr:bifunctional oligoribonuclease/PAP phosphatase NrnA [Paracholeplasma vituli]MCU0105610.1 bifunctional oligoribonuclease/PAP phosphatase NrnA [Paracholeplasma vituli]